MRYPAEEKLEIIRLVERSSRPAKWTLISLVSQERPFIVDMIGIWTIVMKAASEFKDKTTAITRCGRQTLPTSR